MKDKRQRRGIKIQFIISTLILKNVFGFDAMTEKLEEVYFKNVNILFFTMTCLLMLDNFNYLLYPSKSCYAKLCYVKSEV